MSRLSLPIENIKNHYTVVVIGSGYGGGIAASRLDRAGKQVCVLERGKEFFPGDFPSTLPEAAANSQYDTPKGHSGSETNLFDFHTNDDINVLVGCGLGGTSLINANVAIEADPRVFQNSEWPKALAQDLNDGGHVLLVDPLAAIGEQGAPHRGAPVDCQRSGVYWTD